MSRAAWMEPYLAVVSNAGTAEVNFLQQLAEHGLLGTAVQNRAKLATAAERGMAGTRKAAKKASARAKKTTSTRTAGATSTRAQKTTNTRLSTTASGGRKRTAKKTTRKR